MKKKFLLSLIVVVSLFMITACGSKEVDSDNDNTNETDNAGSEYADLELYSDNTKIVFARGDGKVVFYYEGDTITGETAYFDYQDNAAANIALIALNNDNSDTIERAYVQGKYLVVEYNENEYGGLTLENVKLAYSYLEEVKKEEIEK